MVGATGSGPASSPDALLQILHSKARTDSMQQKLQVLISSLSQLSAQPQPDNEAAQPADTEPGAPPSTSADHQPAQPRNHEGDADSPAWQFDLQVRNKGNHQYGRTWPKSVICGDSDSIFRPAG